eukprot:gnl/TRDRNA2_/TRDRNA2_194164_c0_seq1.p1 gnl/TRDRNA2_/TRDRNA2_194164_c0~~gnl/TRDRNA2_/TRDRNA2_194164_c0_seq1.p1  ORF type:complete len:171 (-),score=42.61 gnl/TRDRNA2_/TRDRNA2_194164_c0_seq1:108-599(-)
MEPLRLFDGAEALAATWVQTDDTVVITVPLPSSAAKPTVRIRKTHLSVCCPPADEDGAPSEEAKASVTLLDNELGGEVLTEESAWTFSDGILQVDLLKKPVFEARSKTERPAWWACGVRGGTLGPPDPKAPPKISPNISKLDGKIGEQVTTTGNFQGKSKFAW